MLQTLVQEIHDSGLSEAAIAKEVGVSQPTIHRIRRGKSVSSSYLTADAIKALHETRREAGLIKPPESAVVS